MTAIGLSRGLECSDWATECEAQQPHRLDHPIWDRHHQGGRAGKPAGYRSLSLTEKYKEALSLLQKVACLSQCTLPRGFNGKHCVMAPVDVPLVQCLPTGP